MALTDKEKHEVINYLGWPAKTLVTGSTHYNNLIADRLINLNDDIEILARKMLARLRELDDKMDEAKCRFSTGKVGDITINKNEIHMLRSERSRLRRELHRLLDIPLRVCGGSMVNVVA